MKLTTALRTPYCSTTIVRSAAMGRVSEARLGRSIVVTQLIVAMLCAARVGADWLRGRATIEGSVALALLVAFTMWLTAEAIRGAIREEEPWQGATPYRSSRLRLVGRKDSRSS